MSDISEISDMVLYPMKFVILLTHLKRRKIKGFPKNFSDNFIAGTEMASLAEEDNLGREERCLLAAFRVR